MDVPVGVYTVAATLDGFVPVTVEVRVGLDRTASIERSTNCTTPKHETAFPQRQSRIPVSRFISSAPTRRPRGRTGPRMSRTGGTPEPRGHLVGCGGCPPANGW